MAQAGVATFIYSFQTAQGTEFVTHSIPAHWCTTLDPSIKLPTAKEAQALERVIKEKTSGRTRFFRCLKHDIKLHIDRGGISDLTLRLETWCQQYLATKTYLTAEAGKEQATDFIRFLIYFAQTHLRTQTDPAVVRRVAHAFSQHYCIDSKGTTQAILRKLIKGHETLARKEIRKMLFLTVEAELLNQHGKHEKGLAEEPLTLAENPSLPIGSCAPPTIQPTLTTGKEKPSKRKSSTTVLPAAPVKHRCYATPQANTAGNSYELSELKIDEYLTVNISDSYAALKKIVSEYPEIVRFPIEAATVIALNLFPGAWLNTRGHLYKHDPTYYAIVKEYLALCTPYQQAAIETSPPSTVLDSLSSTEDLMPSLPVRPQPMLYSQPLLARDGSAHNPAFNTPGLGIFAPFPSA